MTKKQIKEMDAIEDGARCSVSVCYKGRTLARLYTAVLHKRTPAPVGFAWRIEGKGRKHNEVFICPDYKVFFFPLNHFKVEL
jgi:hypothetical protein